MAIIKIVDAATISTSPTDSTAVKPDMSPDHYGTVVATHSGSRLAPSSTVRVYLQGSLDGGTSWFDIETMSPADPTYIGGSLNSWCRVVPLAPDIRIRVVNGGGLVYNAWVIE
jgi:hypothetical protein